MLALLALALPAAQGPTVGERFPEPPLPPVSGIETAFALEALRGRPALVHVFASW